MTDKLPFLPVAKALAAVLFWLFCAVVLYRYGVGGLMSSRSDFGFFGGIGLALLGIPLLGWLASILCGFVVESFRLETPDHKETSE